MSYFSKIDGFISIGSPPFIGILFREAMGSGLMVGAVLIAAEAWLAGRTQRVKDNRRGAFVIMRAFLLSVFNGKPLPER